MDKLEVARRELGMALQLFLEDGCAVSTHVLAAAGAEIIEGLVEQSGAEPFFTEVLKAHPGLDRAKLHRTERLFANAFKHINDRKGQPRDDEALLKSFDDETNVALLFKGWTDYRTLTGRLPIEAQALEAWYFWRFLQNDLDVADERAGAVATLPYGAAKTELRGLIRDHRNALDVREHHKTEPRPLVQPSIGHPAASDEGKRRSWRRVIWWRIGRPRWRRCGP